MNYYFLKKQITIAAGTKFYYSFLCSLTEKNSWKRKIGVKSFKCIEFSIFLHLKIFWNEIEGEFFFLGIEIFGWNLYRQKIILRVGLLFPLTRNETIFEASHLRSTHTHNHVTFLFPLVTSCSINCWDYHFRASLDGLNLQNIHIATKDETTTDI